jgi:hypothetical protein
MRHLALMAVTASVVVALYGVQRFWTRELSHLTGAADWIWVESELETVGPRAALLVGALTLEAPPPSALLKVCGDREYVVYVNGTAAACGWSRPGFRLDLYDIAHLLRQGNNVIAVEVRSPTPAGGVLLALDVEGVGRNVLISGPGFVSRRSFDLATVGPHEVSVPVVWGTPPRYPWAYPRPLSHPRTLDEAVTEDPIRVDAARAHALEGGGWEFDLPHPILGYLWLELPTDGLAWFRVVPEGGGGELAELRAESQPVVRVSGQKRWLDPQPQRIERVYVFGRRMPTAVEVWPLAEELSSTAPGAVPGKLGPVPRTRWTTRIPPG